MDKSKPRKITITALISILIVVQLTYIIFPVPELWPFSPYAMYSKIHKNFNSSTGIEIIGVTSDGSEVNLDISRHFTPFNRNNLRVGIINILKKRETVSEKEKRLNLLFEFLLDQYMKNKNANYHKGADLVSLNLYVLTWDWSNVNPRNTEPERKLIYKY
ncbi:MAG: hypothetical protein GTO02_15720 [Candidatus Dadabacteria bacterium]|nr:hypothetical protein [Candidatus Dadabacteria bacterium]NIQ15783.1 hypothetical protein [Candidatus Dadabacteria bacterium]